VIYQNAEDIAQVVRSVFGERIAGAAGGKADAGPPSPQEFMAALRGKATKSPEKKPTSQPNVISVAVDAKSNSLVVVATPQDFIEIRELVETLDNQGMELEETIVTHTMDGSVNPEVLRLALESILGTPASSTTTSKTSKSDAKSSGADADSSQAAEIQRRLEFMKALRDRMGGDDRGNSDQNSGRGTNRAERMLRGLGESGGGGGRGGASRGNNRRGSGK
jgi:hypothetical protein